MKGTFYHCIAVGVLMCTLGTTFAQEEKPLTMRILETNSTDDQFCFYVHANTTESADTIELIMDDNLEDDNVQGTIVEECLGGDNCHTKICYDRPAPDTNPAITEIQCRAVSPTLFVNDGCIVVIYPRGYRTREPIELNIVADCGFATPCDPTDLNPADITHLTLGVPHDEGGFDYIAYAGLWGDIRWFNEDRELIDSGAWTTKVNEVAYVEFNHYQSSIPVLSGFANTLNDVNTEYRVNNSETGTSMVLSNYPNPLSDQTKIQFTLEKDSPVTLDVYDAMGKKMTTIINNTLKTRGEHEIIFDSGSLTSGTYYYTLQAGDYRGTQRMNVVR